MFYVLGTISDENFDKGIMIPERILMQRISTSNYHADFVYVRPRNNNGVNQYLQSVYVPFVLQDNPLSSAPLIEFLSYYRTRNDVPAAIQDKKIKKKKKKTKGEHRPKRERPKKEYIYGKLCALECDRYGNLNGKAVFIKKVPEISGYKRDRSKHILNETLTAQKQDTLRLFYKDEQRFIALEESGISYPNKIQEKKEIKYGKRRERVSDRSSCKRSNSVNKRKIKQTISVLPSGRADNGEE